MSTRIGIYAGTFDPVTFGHIDIIRRALRVVDRLVVGVASESGKNTIFSPEERCRLLQHEIEILNHGAEERVEIKFFSGLLVNFARDVGASILIRGMRVVSDFEYEYQMASANARLMPELETVFLTASENMQFTSSRFVKQICKLGGDITSFVPAGVAEALKRHYESAK